MFSQNTAVDFTTEDCNGNMHNLYDSLESGNIIVIAWVMPCGPCATYAGYAYSAVQSFSVSHPDVVDFYLVDDYANTPCASLVNWGNSNNMSLYTAFSSPDINMMDYGSNGMPKVVVLAGNDHMVYYNDNDDKINYDAVQLAINNALSSLSIDQQEGVDPSLYVYPNPTTGFINIKLEDLFNQYSKIDLLNSRGDLVLNIYDSALSLEAYSDIIDMSGFKKGVYFINAYSISSKEVLKIIVIE